MPVPTMPAPTPLSMDRWRCIVNPSTLMWLLALGLGASVLLGSTLVCVHQLLLALRNFPCVNQR